MMRLNSICTRNVIIRDAHILLLTVSLFCCGCDRKAKNAADTGTDGDASTQTVGQNSPSKFDTKWLPAETELLVHVDVQGLFEAPLLQSENENGETVSMLDSASLDTGLGIELSDIKSITFGVSGISNLDPEAVKEGVEGLNPLKESSIVVIETKEKLDASRIASMEGITPAQHGEHPYLKRDNDDPNYPPLGIYLPGTSTIVVGPETVVQEMLDAGESQVDATPFGFVDSSAHVAVSFVPKDLDKLRNAEGPKSEQDEFKKASEIMQQYADRFGLELSLKEDLDLAVKIHCTDPNQAAILGVELDKISRYAKQQFADNKDQLGMIAGFVAPVVENMAGITNGQTAQISSKLPKDSAKSMAGMAPMLMMMSGFGGGFGGGDMAFGPGGGGGGLDELLETAVPAAEVDGVPTNGTLKAAVHWNDNFFMSNNDEVQPPKQLVVDLILQSEELENVCAYGKLNVQSATTDSGHLRQAKAMMMTGDPSEIVFIDRDDQWTEMPEDGVLISTLYHYPVPQASSITELSGSFQVITAKNRSPYTIKNLLKTAEDGILADALKSAGVKLSVLEPQFEGSSPRVVFSIPSTAIVTGLQAQKGNERANSVWPQVDIGPDGSTEMTIAGQEPKDLEGVDITFTMYTDLTPIDMSFTFNDLEVPEPTEQPTKEQLDLVTWVPSSITEGLPDGLRVESQARWTSMTNYGSDGKPKPRSLEVAIDLIGEPAVNIVAMGAYQLSEMKTDTGNLTPEKKEYGDDPFEKVVEYDAMFLKNEPVNGTQAVLKFEHPDKAPNQVTKLAGELTYVAAKSQEVILIDDIMSKLEAPLEHVALTGEEITLTPKKSGNGIHIAVNGGQPFAIESIQIVDGNGRRIKDVYPGKSTFNGVLTYTFLGQEKLPEDCQLEIVLNQGIIVQTVPFEFANLPVGKEPKAQGF